MPHAFRLLGRPSGWRRLTPAIRRPQRELRTRLHAQTCRLPSFCGRELRGSAGVRVMKRIQCFITLTLTVTLSVPPGEEQGPWSLLRRHSTFSPIAKPPTGSTWSPPSLGVVAAGYQVQSIRSVGPDGRARAAPGADHAGRRRGPRSRSHRPEGRTGHDREDRLASRRDQRPDRCEILWYRGTPVLVEIYVALEQRHRIALVPSSAVTRVLALHAGIAHCRRLRHRRSTRRDAKPAPSCLVSLVAQAP